MTCPVCSTDSIFNTAQRREAQLARDMARRLSSEVLGMAQEVRDISSRLRHKAGTDSEAADMLDELARRMAAETTHTISRMNERG